MTILKPPWLGPVLVENFTYFQVLQITNPDLFHAGFTPVSHNAAGHMLEVIILEKGTLQVVDDHIEAAGGGVPDLGIVGAPGRIDPDQYESLFELRDAHTGSAA